MIFYHSQSSVLRLWDDPESTFLVLTDNFLQATDNYLPTDRSALFISAHWPHGLPLPQQQKLQSNAKPRFSDPKDFHGRSSFISHAELWQTSHLDVTGYTLGQLSARPIQQDSETLTGAFKPEVRNKTDLLKQDEKVSTYEKTDWRRLFCHSEQVQGWVGFAKCFSPYGWWGNCGLDIWLWTSVQCLCLSPCRWLGAAGHFAMDFSCWVPCTAQGSRGCH